MWVVISWVISGVDCNLRNTERCRCRLNLDLVHVFADRTTFVEQLSPSCLPPFEGEFRIRVCCCLSILKVLLVDFGVVAHVFHRILSDVPVVIFVSCYENGQCFVETI